MSAKKTKVLMAIGALYGGGAETQCRLLCAALNPELYDVAVVCFNDEKAQSYPKNVKIFCVGGKKDAGIFTRIGRLWKTIRQFNPDIIHNWLPDTMVVPAAVFGRMLSKRVISSRRTSFMSVFKGGSARDYLNLAAELFSNAVVSNSDVDPKNSWLFGAFFKMKRGSVIRNGIDLSVPENPEMLAKIGADKKFKIAYVGRLAPTKRLDILLESFARLKAEGANISLYLCGFKREQFPEAAEILAKYGADLADVHFLGFVKNWTSFGRAFDLFAFPSVLEGMSNVVVEAFSCGIPVLACDIPANSSICEKSKDIVLAEPNNLEDFSARMKDLVQDCQKRRALAASAERVAEKFSAAAMAAAYEKLYENLLAPRK